jgi:hypothetical protein
VPNFRISSTALWRNCYCSVSSISVYKVRKVIKFQSYSVRLFAISVNTNAQNNKGIDSINSLLTGKWQLTKDTKDIWIFNEKFLYEYYNEPGQKDRDTDKYKVIDTTLSILHPVYKKSYCLLRYSNKDSVYYKIEAIDNDNLILIPLENGRFFEFEKRSK